MPVQQHQCTWPTCFQETTLLCMIGLDGKIHVACPFHHDWILRDMEQTRGAKAAMPVAERKNPTGLVDIAKHPFHAFCDKEKCYYSVSTKTYEEGVAQLTQHACPYIGGPTKIGLLVSRTQLVQAWEKLDSAVAELIEGKYPPIPTDESEDADFRENPEKTRLVGVCRGIAEMLAIFMQPHFDHPDQISAEAKRRYTAKKNGEDYTTPGLEPHHFAQPRSPEYKAANNKGATPVQPRNPAPSPVHKFTEDEVGSIKFAHESGMFTVEQLAKTYKVKVEVINKVLAG